MAVGDEQVYARISGRNPHIHLSKIALDMGADKVLSGMNCE